MSLIISIFLGLKGLAIVIGTMVSGGDKGNVTLIMESMRVEGDSVIVELRIDSVFSPELDELLASGTGIPLTTAAVLYSDGKETAREQQTHTVRYDLLSGEYWLMTQRGTDTLSGREQMKTGFSRFSVPLFAIGDLAQGVYTVEAECWLETIELDILNRQKFDLMSLWKFNRPFLKTRPFTRRDIIPGSPEQE